MSMTIDHVLVNCSDAALIVDDVRWSGEDLRGAAGRLAEAITPLLGNAHMLTVSCTNAALLVAAVAAAEQLRVPVQLLDPAATSKRSAVAEDVLIGEDVVIAGAQVVTLGPQLDCPLLHRDHRHGVPLHGSLLPADGVLFQTSGSTAAPRAVVKQLAAVLRDSARIADHLYGAESTPHIVCAVPVFHSYGFTHGVLASLIAAATTTYCAPSTSPQSLAKLVGRTGAGAMIALPNHVHMVAMAKSLQFEGLRQMVSAGAPLRAEAVAQVCHDHQFRLLNAYGASEVGTVSIASMDENSAPGSIGEPMAGVEVRFDPGDSELLIRSDSFAAGYFTEGELRALPTKDGWYRSGDLAERDTAGLRITGRLGDVINIAGRKTRRSRLEAVLSQHPDVLEVQVLTAKDEFRGEFPVARAVVKPGHEQPDILGWSRDMLDAFEIPRQVHWVDRLPRTATGKLSYAPAIDDLQADDERDRHVQR